MCARASVQGVGRVDQQPDHWLVRQPANAPVPCSLAQPAALGVHFPSRRVGVVRGTPFAQAVCAHAHLFAAQVQHIQVGEPNVEPVSETIIYD